MQPTRKSMLAPDETRKFDRGQMEILTIGDTVLGRATFEPGWKWSECVKPLAGTDSCEVHHNGYILSGRMRIRMDDGTEIEVGEGDFFVCPPGHDAWTLGDQSCVALDFSTGITEYAKEA